MGLWTCRGDSSKRTNEAIAHVFEGVLEGYLTALQPKDINNNESIRERWLQIMCWER